MSPAQSNQAGQALTVWEAGSAFPKRVSTSIGGRHLDRRTEPLALPVGPSWMSQANCRGRDDLDALFFPGEGRSGARVDPEIREMCSLCPVRVECLAHAIRTASDGIWAGTTATERRRMVNATRPPLPPPGSGLCRYGHELDGQLSTTGRRYCKRCDRESSRRRRAS